MRSSAVMPLVIACALAACTSGAGSHGPGGSATDEYLAGVYGNRLNGAAEAKAELLRRNVFTPQEAALIDNFQLRPGMNEVATMAVYRTSAIKSWTSDTNKNGAVVGRHFVVNCQIANVPNCPYPWTTVDAVGGKIAGIRPSAPGEIPRT